MYYKQPHYFGDFKCIGGSCQNSCCCGWSVRWSKDEVDKLLKNENMSYELRSVAESSFVPLSDLKKYFTIQMKDDAKCPFLTEDMLCKIQKELGEEYLSDDCYDYPRKYIYINNMYYACCSMTCPEVIKHIINDEKSIEFVTVNKNENKRIDNNPDDIKNHPEQAYWAEMFDFFYELFSDKNIEIERALMLGSIAAERLTQTIGQEEYASIPDEIKQLRRELKAQASLDVVNDVKPNLRAKLGFLPLAAEQIAENAATRLLHDDEGYINMELYNRGEQRLNEMLKSRRYFFRNIALNLLIDLSMPFRIPKKTVFENYCLYITAFGCIKLNIIASLSIDNPITIRTAYSSDFKYEDKESEIIGFTALLCRNLCNSLDRSQKLIDLLREQGFDNHAYLAAFVL